MVELIEVSIRVAIRTALRRMQIAKDVNSKYMYLLNKVWLDENLCKRNIKNLKVFMTINRN